MSEQRPPFPDLMTFEDHERARKRKAHAEREAGRRLRRGEGAFIAAVKLTVARLATLSRFGQLREQDLDLDDWRIRAARMAASVERLLDALEGAKVVRVTHHAGEDEILLRVPRKE